MDPLEILARLTDDDAEPPSTAELTAARDEVRALIDAATDPADPDVELAEELSPALDALDAELTARDEQTQAARDRAAELRAAAGIVDADDDAADDDDDGSGDGHDGDAPAPVNAAAVMERLRAVVANRPAPEPEPEPETRAIARAVGPAVGDDGPVVDLSDAARIFTRYAPHVGRKQRSSLIRLDLNYPQARTLGDDTDTNTRRLDAVMAPRAVTAAGGICDALEADFSHPICGDRGRPVRDSLPSFNAARGGIRYAPSATLADVEGAVAVWTAANDASPGSDGPATKPCPQVDCPTEVECVVDAVTACLTIGNFQARFSPELWASRLDLLMVLHDQIAEQQLIAALDAASTQTTYNAGGGVNTVVDVLQAIDRAVAAVRNRNRLIGTSTAVRLVAPSWLLDAFRSALAANSNCGGVEAYAAADATIGAWFAARNVVPTWTPDWQEFMPQPADAPLADYPADQVEFIVYPEGTFAFLDGGTIDLGTEITDSALNATNDRQAFMETFEQLCYRGCESLAVTVPITDGCVCQPSLAEPVAVE